MVGPLVPNLINDLYLSDVLQADEFPNHFLLLQIQQKNGVFRPDRDVVLTRRRPTQRLARKSYTLVRHGQLIIDAHLVLVQTQNNTIFQQQGEKHLLSRRV